MTFRQYNFDFKKDDGKFTVEVDTTECYGCFEHNTLGDEYRGGLWFERDGSTLKLIDYDGVICLPKRVIDTLRDAGYTVGKEFE